MSKKVIACVGQKGGVGKSIISQMVAVDYANKGSGVTLIDLDTAQRSSYEWGQTRDVNGYKPRIDVQLLDPDRRTNGYDFRNYESKSDVLVLDAPGWSDEKTLKLAAYADQIIMPSGASTADMRPTIRLMHEIVGKGVEPNKIAPVLCRVQSTTEIKNAREYFEIAGYRPMAGMLKEMPSYRTLQNQGLSAIEADNRSKSMLQDAKHLVGSLVKHFEAGQTQDKPRAERYIEQPERLEDIKRMAQELEAETSVQGRKHDQDHGQQ